MNRRLPRSLRFYLLRYDTKRGELLDIEEFEDRRRALDARFALQRAERERPHIEVVVLGASSRETLTKTHSRYFKTLGELAAPI